jgi:hypothetical protein
MREAMLAWDDLNTGEVRFYKYVDDENWHKNIHRWYDSQKVLKAAQQAHPDFHWKIETPTLNHPIGDVVLGVKG